MRQTNSTSCSYLYTYLREEMKSLNGFLINIVYKSQHYKVKSLLRNYSLDFANITTKVLLLTRGWLRPHWTQATKTLGLRWKEKMVTHFRMNESSLFKRIDIASKAPTQTFLYKGRRTSDIWVL